MKSDYFILSRYFFRSQKRLNSIMPCWYYEKEDLEHTPSIKDGIDPGTEARYRREGSRFIIEAGTTQKLYPFFLWYDL